MWSLQDFDPPTIYWVCQQIGEDEIVGLARQANVVPALLSNDRQFARNNFKDGRTAGEAVLRVSAE
jgi:hypothetical protein